MQTSSIRFGSAKSTREELAERQQAAARKRASTGLRQVPHSFAADGGVRFGDTLVVRNVKDGAVLVNDVWTEVAPERVLAAAELLAPHESAATARSTFVVARVDSGQGPGRRERSAGRTYDRDAAQRVRIGESFQLQCNPSLLVNEALGLLDAPLFLCSERAGVCGEAHAVSMTRDASDPRTHFVAVPAACLGDNNPHSDSMTLRRGSPLESADTVVLQNVMSNLALRVGASAGDGRLSVSCARPSRGGSDSAALWRLELSDSVEAAVDTRELPPHVTEPKALLRKIREALTQRGTSMYGIREISRTFRTMDTNRNGLLDRDELRRGLAQRGMTLDSQQIEAVFSLLDSSADGALQLDEFLRALRGPLKRSRLALILMAYQVLDRDGDGVVRLAELAEFYDTSHHPEVIDGTKTHEEAVAEFVAQWDNGGEAGQGRGDGVVTKEEFLHYYRDVSASIDDDAYFELMMRNAWHLSGGEGQSANTANIRALVHFEDGSSRVVEVQNDFGIARSDMPAIRAALRRQGLVNFTRVELAG